MTSPTKHDIERHLRTFGSEHEPKPGWQQRVLAATAPKSRYGIVLAVLATIVAGAILAWLLWPRATHVRYETPSYRDGEWDPPK